MKEVYFEPIQIQRYLLLAVGAWPNENPSLFFTIRKCISWTTNLTFAGLLLYAIYENSNDVKTISEVVYILVAMICANLKTILFHSRQSTFLEIYRELDHPVFDVNSEKFKTVMNRYSKICKLIASLHLGSLVTIVLLFGGFPLISSQPLFTYVHTETLWLRGTMYGFQWVFMAIGGAHTGSMDTVFMGMMGTGAAYLEYLNQRLIHLRQDVIEQLPKNGTSSAKEEEIDRRIREELKKCVVCHQKIIKYVKGVDHIFQISTFVQLFLGTVLLNINIGLNLVKTSPTSPEFLYNIVVFVSSTIQLGMLCVFGNDVIEKSLGVSRACYHSEWYNCSNGAKKYLYLIMERAKYPLTITAYKFIPLSLATFQSIMRSSYSYFSVLLNVYKE